MRLRLYLSFFYSSGQPHHLIFDTDTDTNTSISLCFLSLDFLVYYNESLCSYIYIYIYIYRERERERRLVTCVKKSLKSRAKDPLLNCRLLVYQGRWLTNHPCGNEYEHNRSANSMYKASRQPPKAPLKKDPFLPIEILIKSQIFTNK